MYFAREGVGPREFHLPVSSPTEGGTPPSPRPSPPGEGVTAPAYRPSLCFCFLSRPSEHRGSPPAVSDNGDGVRDKRRFWAARFDRGTHFSLSWGRGPG